jgi:hypothetical protein
VEAGSDAAAAIYVWAATVGAGANDRGCAAW